MPLPMKSQLSSSAQIDVLIPAIEKDLTTLPYVVSAVKKHVKHPIGNILIVAPNRKRITELCRRKGYTFVNENSVLPITKKHIHYRSRTWDRSGWLFQQLLKLSGDTICSSNYFLVIDADTVLIRPHRFRKDGKTIVYCRSWSQPEYFNTYRRLLKRRAPKPTSFVTHYMLFEKSKLAQLKKAIESNHRVKWYSAILHSIDKSKQFGFSEFETYGNFLYTQSPGGLLLKKALNKSLPISVRQLTPGRISRLAGRYRSISFHQRKGYYRKAVKRSR
ncbi:DUF6492 family protein [Paenibacillus beijingensis]|uniref:Glycosyltransferase n=1 Tax=Paenibacillus beijingensis TaxID=1126833 RepID=A0A0D5NHH1_9BACL|nr:DUF6492 family protein [Paenibacillus beijingensis]AJY74701.1 hypothetical protein VN24_09030 [Paenibacillus beijingensis]